MFNLINILGQNTLPEQVEINKQNIAILADEVEKLGYQPKGVYDAETEYNHNNVVFYDNKLYVVTSDAAIVGVLPTNTTYWQQVTGDIRGQQGATGAQGPAGADGTNGTDGVDGKPVLWYNLNILLPNTAAFNTLLTESSHDFTKAYFSRVGDVGDEFMCFVNIADSNTSFALIYRIIAWPEGINYCTAVRQNVYASMTGRKGDTGATGKDALVYGETIPFSRGESSTQLIEQNLPFANFNRTPELNEDFIAILHDTLTLKDYIANVEVQIINSGSQVVSACVASNIALITGTNGTNGTDGTDGEPALTYSKINAQSAAPAVGQNTQLDLANLNRTPKLNDITTIVIKANLSNKTYLAVVQITNPTYSETKAMGQILQVVETTGEAGASYNNYIYTSGAHSTIYRILNNAKGRVNGEVRLTINSVSTSIPANCFYKFSQGLRFQFAGSNGNANEIVIIFGEMTLASFTIYNCYVYNLNTNTISATPTSTSISSCYLNYYNDSEIS